MITATKTRRLTVALVPRCKRPYSGNHLPTLFTYSQHAPTAEARESYRLRFIAACDQYAMERGLEPMKSAG